jgi:hypothetical protein
MTSSSADAVGLRRAKVFTQALHDLDQKADDNFFAERLCSCQKVSVLNGHGTPFVGQSSVVWDRPSA